MHHLSPSVRSSASIFHSCSLSPPFSALLHLFFISKLAMPVKTSRLIFNAAVCSVNTRAYRNYLTRANLFCCFIHTQERSPVRLSARHLHPGHDISVVGVARMSSLPSTRLTRALDLHSKCIRSAPKRLGKVLKMFIISNL